LLDAIGHRGYGEGHMALIVDVRHGVDPLGRHLGAATQHALVARLEGKPPHERFLELAIVVAIGRTRSDSPEASVQVRDR